MLSTILLAVQGPEDNFKGDDEALEELAEALGAALRELGADC